MKMQKIIKSTYLTLATGSALCLGLPIHAQLLTPTIGGVSSNYPNALYVVAGLTDGSPTLGSASGLGNEWASSGTGNAGDEDPVVKFSFSKVETLTGLDYAQRADGPGYNTGDLVGTIDLYFVSAQTYNTFTPTSGSTPAQLTLALGAPSEVVTPSEANADFNANAFATAENAQYIIAQFVGDELNANNPNETPGQGGNPGGAELRFVGSAFIPEPSSLSLMLGGLGVAGLFFAARRRSC